MNTSSDKLSVPLAPLLAQLDCTPEVTALLRGCDFASVALARLMEAGQLIPAARLAAFGLPKREAVWWACMCARHVPPQAPQPADTAALDAAEAWVRRPEEASRRAAAQAGQAAGHGSAEAWAATAAGWSGGSLAPEGQPVVPPAPHLTGTAVAGAVLLAANRVAAHGGPERALQRLDHFLQAARDIAQGGAGRLAPETAG